MAAFGVFFLIWLAALVLMAWAAIDAALVPDSAWHEADQSKIVWVLISVFLPIVGALAYLIAIRPRLRSRPQV
ncbi:MAG TPA: PLDc N-terminal domain-containing protein [Actinomycetota bacterium]|jgi:hypothetical protein|nr:PLDc N-terminal domain-containing protein [Actinomycetota bacterium]